MFGAQRSGWLRVLILLAFALGAGAAMAQSSKHNAPATPRPEAAKAEPPPVVQTLIVATPVGQALAQQGIRKCLARADQLSQFLALGRAGGFPS